MNRAEVNINALSDAVKLLVGDQGYEIVARVYGALDVAEGRGYSDRDSTARGDAEEAFARGVKYAENVPGGFEHGYDLGYAEGYENGVKDGVCVSDVAEAISGSDDGLIHIPGIGLVSAKATQLNYADEETIAVAEALSDLTDQGFYDAWSQRFHQ